MPRLPTAQAIRRTLALPASSKDDLERIKGSTSARNDTAAIKDAVSFRASLAEHNLEEIRDALSVWDELKRLVKVGATVVTPISNGLMIESATDLPGRPHERTRVVFRSAVLSD
jgi:hypothetical protein